MPEFIPGVSKHAQLRMREHYGDASRAEWLDIVLQILDQRAVLVATQLPRSLNESWNETYACQWRGEVVLVVWIPLTAITPTVLPRDASAARYLREKLGFQKPGVTSMAENVRKERRDAWRREWDEA